MTTYLPQLNYTYNVNDGVPPNPIQISPVPGYTTYVSWEFTPVTAQPGIDTTLSINRR